MVIKISKLGTPFGTPPYTKDEIREVLIQVAIYAGVPCGVDAFRLAHEAFKEVEAA